MKLGNISALSCFERHNFPPLFPYFAHYPQVKSESVSHWVMSHSLQLHGLPPGSSVHGILQARILEWVAISLSKGSSWVGDRTWVSCIVGRFFTVWATREANCPQNTTRKTVLLPDHLLFKILKTYVIKPADVFQKQYGILKIHVWRTAVTVHWLKLCLPMQRVWSLVGELRSHVPPSQKTKT